MNISKSILTCAAAAIALGTGMAQAAWVENFDSVAPGTTYTTGNPAGWTANGANAGLRSSTGAALSSPNSAYGTVEGGSMSRPTDSGDDTFTFSFYWTPLPNAPTLGAAMNLYAGDSATNSGSFVGFQIDQRDATNAAWTSNAMDTLRFTSSTTSNLWDIRAGSLTAYTWYDGRIIFNGDGTADLGYKASSSGTWIENLNVSVGSFDFDYVFMNGSNPTSLNNENRFVFAETLVPDRFPSLRRWR